MGEIKRKSGKHRGSFEATQSTRPQIESHNISVFVEETGNDLRADRQLLYKMRENKC